MTQLIISYAPASAKTLVRGSVINFTNKKHALAEQTRLEKQGYKVTLWDTRNNTMNASVFRRV